MLLGDNKVNDNSRTYQKQVHVYDNVIHMHIVYQDKATEYESRGGGLWRISLNKEFRTKTKFFKMTPKDLTEADYKRAHAWADEQLELLRKYGTTKVSKMDKMTVYD